MKRYAPLLACFPLSCALAATDCRVVAPLAQAGEELRWSGACKDGFAEGAGVLAWDRKDKPRLKYEVTLVRGAISGEGSMSSADGDKYIGSFRDGVPDGWGYFRYADGSQYEGDIVHGEPQGQGTRIEASGTRYDGSWRHGKLNGRARATFAFGGSYDGEWKDDKFDGKGVITYAGSGRRAEGEFRDGRLAGAPPPPAATYTLSEVDIGPGLRILPMARSLPVPAGKSYAQLSAGEQASVKAGFLTLAPEDEPPYPLHGPKMLLSALSHEAGILSASGTLELDVVVGSDGTAQSVKATGTTSPEMKKFAAQAVMVEQYKPAGCAGKPCEMVYPFAFNFSMF